VLLRWSYDDAPAESAQVAASAASSATAAGSFLNATSAPIPERAGRDERDRERAVADRDDRLEAEHRPERGRVVLVVRRRVAGERDT
jgi:hypothetical protein